MLLVWAFTFVNIMKNIKYLSFVDDLIPKLSKSTGGIRSQTGCTWPTSNKLCPGYFYISNQPIWKRIIAQVFMTCCNIFFLC